MRWHPIRPCLRLVLSVLGLACLLSLGLAAPRPPAADELRAVSHVLAGGSLADICGSGGHPAAEGRCQQCCFVATAPAPTMPRTATRSVRRPYRGSAPARPGLRRAVRRDRTRSVRAPPVG